MKFLTRLFAFALFLCPAISPAQTTLVAPNNGGSYILPSTGGSVLYGASDPAGNYLFKQWNEPVSDLSAFAPVACAPTYTNCFQAVSPNITDTIWTAWAGSNGTSWADLTTNGSNVPCAVNNHEELDNDWEPTYSSFPGYPQGIVGITTLDAISTLPVSVVVLPITLSQFSNRCATTQGVFALEFVFTNVTTTPITQFVYHLALLRYPSAPGVGWYDNNGPVFGYKDYIARYSRTYKNGIPMNVTTALNIDIYARMTAAMQTATNGMDTNIADWQGPSQVYVYNSSWGDMNMESQWCCLSVTGQ